MTDRRSEQPAQHGPGIPRDLPDQQVGGSRDRSDPWEGTTPGEEGDGREDEVPDTDEAGTGRRPSGRSAATAPTDPSEPEENSG